MVGRCRKDPAHAGQALLIVLAILLAVTASSASFIWFMNQQQTRAGQRYRALAALRVAEAGVQRALEILESEAPDGTPGREWRPVAYGESMTVGALTGAYTVRVADEDGGALVITSEGRVGDVVRRLRARAVLASPALLSALFVASTAQFERSPAATFLLPYGAGIGDRPWFHVAAGQEIWFAHLHVSLNDPALPYETAPGPVDAIGGVPPSGARPGPEPLRVLLADGAALTLGPDRLRIDATQLRLAGIRLDGDIRRVRRLPATPEVDRDYYRALAAANAANAEINRSAGRRAGDADLERKRDSLYDRHQMARVIAFLAAEFASEGRTQPLRGVIYVRGPATIPSGIQVRIADGALIAESTVQVDPGESSPSRTRR